MSNFAGCFCVLVAMAHVMEPSYPGVSGHYINLGAFYDRKALRADSGKLLALTKNYKEQYAAAYRCFHTANEVRRHEEIGILTPGAVSKVEKRVQGILSREVKRRKGEDGNIIHRLLGGLTCQGKLFLLETVHEKAKRVYELQESCGLAPLMLRMLEEGIVRAGYDVISSPAAEDPTKLEHLLVPELSLAFVTTMPGARLEKRPFRRIRMDSMAEKEVLQAARSKLRFAGRIADGLLEDGIEKLRQAKQIHDEMEALYHPHVDFHGIDKLTKSLLAEIRAL